MRGCVCQDLMSRAEADRALPAQFRFSSIWNPPCAKCGSICAVLAAVTEVIRSQGGKETETEYFAALVSGCDLQVGGLSE